MIVKSVVQCSDATHDVAISLSWVQPTNFFGGTTLLHASVDNACCPGLRNNFHHMFAVWIICWFCTEKKFINITFSIFLHFSCWQLSSWWLQLFLLYPATATRTSLTMTSNITSEDPTRMKTSSNNLQFTPPETYGSIHCGQSSGILTTIRDH